MVRYTSGPFKALRVTRAFVAELLPPVARRWLYTVAAAAIAAAVTLGWWPPVTLTAATPLLVALLMVEKSPADEARHGPAEDELDVAPRYAAGGATRHDPDNATADPDV